MYCSKCGTYNADGAAFCAGCGAPLGQPPLQPRPQYQTAPQISQQPARSSQAPVLRPAGKSKKAMAVVIAVLSVLLAAAIVVILVLALGGNIRKGSISDLHEEPKLENAFFDYFDALTTFNIEKAEKVIHPAMRGRVQEDNLEYLMDRARRENAKFRNLQVTKVLYRDKEDFRGLEETLENMLSIKIRVDGIAEIRYNVDIVRNGQTDFETGAVIFFKTEGKWYFLN